MWVEEVWRYPVKSMAGERLASARISREGIEGDRVVQVRDARGSLVTARTHPALLGHHGTLGADGEPQVDGRPWNSLSVLEEVQQIAGPKAQLVRDDGVQRFDVLPLLVATDGAIAAFGRDRRRLRPNLVIGGVNGLGERTWPGSKIWIGEVLIEVEDLRGRCVMTTFDPDTLVQDNEVLRDIVRHFGGRLALNCRVIRGGIIRVAQKVKLAHAG